MLNHNLKTRQRILIVDDERSLRETLAIALEGENYEITLAASAEEATKLLNELEFAVVLTDVRMSGADGVELLKHVKEVDETIEVIVMTAFGTAANAVEAMKRGAYDYLAKPFNLDELRVLLRRACERCLLARENSKLRQQAWPRWTGPNLVAKSKAMQDVLEHIKRVGSMDVTVLVTGESGVGKEVVARAIHTSGSRAEGPFVAVNCGALPESLVEAELFGYERGAFTGADKARAGLLEQADGGTMFLDEIGELPLAAQVKLLRVVQEQTVRRLGDSKERRLNIRIISATNRSLEEQVKSGKFREDLFYRLNVFHIKIPPLRERVEDIPLLVDNLLDKIGKRLGLARAAISEQALQKLCMYRFPGNVRELENVLERALILAKNGQIDLEQLPADLREPSGLAVASKPTIGPHFNLDYYLADIERQYYIEALKQADGVRSKAAEILGLSFRQFRYKAKKFGL